MPREHKSSAKAVTRSKSGANTTWKGMSEELEVGDYRVVNRGGLIANIEISVRWMEYGRTEKRNSYELCELLLRNPSFRAEELGVCS